MLHPRLALCARNDRTNRWTITAPRFDKQLSFHYNQQTAPARIESPDPMALCRYVDPAGANYGVRIVETA